LRAMVIALLIGAVLAGSAGAGAAGASPPAAPGEVGAARSPGSATDPGFAPGEGAAATPPATVVAPDSLAGRAPAPDPDLEAWSRAMTAARGDWAAWVRMLRRTSQKLRVFRAEYESYRAIVADPDSLRRLEDARRTLGWDEDGAAGKLDAFTRALDRLRDDGFPDTLATLTAALEALGRSAPEAGDLTDFARGLDPAAPEGALPPALQRPSTLFRAGRDRLDRVEKRLPRSASLVLWIETWDEAAALYDAAGDRLIEVSDRFPRDPLCGDPERWHAARRAFLLAAAGRAGLADCRAFLSSDAYPGVDAPAWESPAHVFLFDPASSEGFLVDRARAEAVRRYRRLLTAPPAAGVAAFAADAGRVRLREWGGRDRVLFAALGCADPLAEALKLPPETFRARVLLDPAFAAAVDSLAAAHEGHAYVAGWVVDARTEGPLAGASVTFAAGGAPATDSTDARGRFGVAFPGAPGRVYRGTVSLAGYQAVTETGLLPDRILADRRFVLNRVPEPFVVMGRVYHRASRIPVRGAEVTAGTVHGTRARAVTGTDGGYRLIVQAAQNEVLTVKASRVDASASTRLTVLGPERRGVDLVLDLAPTADTAGILAPPDTAGEGSEFEGEAPAFGGAIEDEEPPAPTITVPDSITAAAPESLAVPDSAAVPAGALFAPAGPPLTRTTTSGGCKAGVLRLDLPPHAFPAGVGSGQSAGVRVTLTWIPEDAAGEVRIMVRAFFFDSPPQNAEVRLSGAGSRTVSFAFPTDTVDLSGKEGTVGVGAGLRVECADGTRADRVVSAYQGYRRIRTRPAGGGR
jgi:hypothetical protein